MKTANEVWPVAVKQFTESYGGSPDLRDEVTDKPVFLGMLEKEIRKSVRAELAAAIRKGTERIEAIADDFDTSVRRIVPDLPRTA